MSPAISPPLDRLQARIDHPDEHRGNYAGGRDRVGAGLEQARLARDAYSYLHLPIVTGVVLFAMGLETTLGHPNDALETVPAMALSGGAALYPLGHVAFLFRTTARIFRRRTLGAVVLLALIPVTLAILLLAALAAVAAVCALVVAYEAIRYREHRVRVRHPKPRPDL